MGPLSAWTGTEMTELTLEKELVGEGATANHLFSYTSRVSGHRLQEKVEMAFFIPCFSVFTYPLKISYNVFWPPSFSSLSSSQILPLASLIRLLDREWRQEVDGVEKRRGKGPCSAGRSCQGQGWSPRESSQESKLKIKDLGSALLWFHFEPARARRPLWTMVPDHVQL